MEDVNKRLASTEKKIEETKLKAEQTSEVVTGIFVSIIKKV
jgi:hypothetical protein